MLTIFIPQDTTAVAVGANRVAAAFLERAKALAVDLQIIRNGSRGAFGLEPLVEVERGEDRVAFGAVKVSDVPGIVDCLTSGSYEHEMCLGSSADIPWFSAQTRITFKRCTRPEAWQALKKQRALIYRAQRAILHDPAISTHNG